MKLNFLAFILLFSGAIAAQPKFDGPKIRFTHTEHDFGRISERMGKARHSFTFVNVGKGPLYLSNVTSSCGCTTPFWTKDTVWPGDTGHVDAEYETYTHNGEFSKNLMVYSNAEFMNGITLTVSGMVYDPNEENSATNRPFRLNYVSVDNATLDFKDLYNNEKDTLYVRLTNESLAEVHITDIKDLPEWATVIDMPSSIDPKETVKIGIAVDGSKINDFGFVSARFMVMTDIFKNEAVFLFATANVKEHFPKKVSKNAPKIQLSKTYHDFGKIKLGLVGAFEVEITNKGKSDLVFHKFENYCECLTIMPPKKVLAPGETMILKVAFSSITRLGQEQNKSFNIITNDPVHPVSTVGMHATLID